ncbi:MAG: SRPBCC domain-containing protein [Bacteroidetes bacterium]|nr:SRPBCC domain-containing protein [Bacteroidota bacterium]
MPALTKYTLEYAINSSQKVLFNRLSTAGGLSEWFADDVTVKGKIYKFIWDGFESPAELVARKDMKYVKFQWLDDDKDGEFFEFRIDVDEITGSVALIITDFAEEDEMEDAIKLWDTQIAELKHILGTE